MANKKKILLKKEVIEAIFEGIFSASHSIYTTLLSRMDGHAVAKKARTEFSESTLAAMTSSCMSLGDRISAEVQQNKCDFVIIQNEDGYLALKKVGTELVITVLADKNINLGMLLTATKDAAKKLEHELSQSVRV